MSKSELLKFLGIIYLIFACYIAYLFRGFSLDDFFVFLFVIIICIFTDIGGYIFGKLFKGPKLTKISPNKTYAGVIGSYFFSIIFAYFYIIKYSNILNNESEFLIKVIIISTVSQFGDLFISYFKRLAKIKNTGSLLPGHGGLLDRVDGIIFAIPFGYFYMIFFNL